MVYYNFHCIRHQPTCSTSSSVCLIVEMILTLCSLHWWCFPSINWHEYSTCTHCGHHPLQLVLMVFFLPPITTNTLLALMQLALCGGCCIRWLYIHVVLAGSYICIWWWWWIVLYVCCSVAWLGWRSKQLSSWYTLYPRPHPGLY